MPQYTSFATAWTAWLARLTDYDYRLSRWSDQLLGWNNATTITGLRSAGNLLFVNLFNQINDHTDYNTATDYTYSGHYMATYYARYEGGGATMDDILTAMLGAKFDQLQKFIGIEQAYMAAIWNAPFNGEYYAALARGFRQWP